MKLMVKHSYFWRSAQHCAVRVIMQAQTALWGLRCM